MKKILLALVISLLATCANAATCFWVGGTGTWSTANTASWASSTGGTAGTCAATGGIPKQSADTATFDASSGGGTVTVDPTTMTGVTLTGITMGSFTGTLDFSSGAAINITLSATFSVTGSGTRTLKLGSGTFTLTTGNGTAWDATTITGLTFNAGTSMLATSGAVAGGGFRTLILNNLTYGTISLNSQTGGNTQTLNCNACTITNFNLAAPGNVIFTSAQTTNITNAFNWTGSSSAPLFIGSTATNATATISVATGSPTISWAAIRYMAFTGGATFAATNSFNLGSNTGISISGPSGGGGGGHIIGG